MHIIGSSIDFNSDRFNITIESGQTSGSFNLPITCDAVVEDDEHFNVTFLLAEDNDQITIGQSTAVVRITDSTGKK